MNTMMQFDENDASIDKDAIIRVLEQRYQSLEAYHRRLEAEARAQEARAIEGAMPGALILGGLWLAVTILKSRRR